MPNQEKKIKIGLLGAGGFGEKIASIILKTKNLELFSLFDLNLEKAEAQAKKNQCKVAHSFTEMLNDKNIAAVVIATPNHLHKEQILACLKNKKHIFVEKPITNTIADAKKIIQEFKKHPDLVLMVGHNLRRTNAVRKMKELILKGKIGDLVSAEINMSHSGGMKQTPETWRYYRDKCPGGPLMMLGSHSAEVSNYLFGPAKKIGAILKKQYAPTQNPDTSLMLIELEAGNIVYICNNYNTPATHFIRVYGTEGILVYDRNLATLTFQSQDMEKRPQTLELIKYETNDIILEEMEEFGDCVLQGKQPETSIKEAFNALAIIEAGLVSQEQNRFIAVEKI